MRWGELPCACLGCRDGAVMAKTEWETNKMSVCFLGLLGLSLEYDGAMRESPRRREETGKEEIRHQATQCGDGALTVR